MTAYILDSSALIRYVDDEAGAERVEELLGACAAGKTDLYISAIQWGEVAGNLRKRLGSSQERRILSTLLPSEAEIIPVDGERAVRAAEIKVDRNISYADAIALELAMSFPDHVLVTADYGFKAVEDLARMEFLSAK
ncbi:MAG: PIN domain-containing protein [Terracidiphilus sp.]